MARAAEKFEALVLAYSSELFRYAYWLCGESSQAEDLVQETFARAWRALASLRDEHAARRWLYTIVRREYARQFERVQPEVIDLDAVQLPAPSVHDTRTEAVMLRHALRQLPPAYRDPLLLQVLGGFSCAEIGAILDLSANTVMTRVFRARRRLRDLLTRESAWKEMKL